MGAIIGLSGYSGAGKDYVADAIIKDFPEYEFKKVYFADHLKKVAAMMLGYPLHLMYSQEGKQTTIDWLDGMTIRTFLQKFGTDAVRNNVHADFWPRSLMNTINVSDNVIIPDMRFKNELNAVAEAGFYARVSRFATYTEWNKLSGLKVNETIPEYPGVISKPDYINEVTRTVKYGGDNYPEYGKALASMIHESETNLDFASFPHHYNLKTGEKPNHGIRLGKYIFENGYIKMPPHK